jgi:hypothetical protein
MLEFDEHCIDGRVGVGPGSDHVPAAEVIDVITDDVPI